MREKNDWLLIILELIYVALIVTIFIILALCWIELNEAIPIIKERLDPLLIKK